ncbi:uncharacterized protein (DUF2252 family) [Murinocardiopsis flavida]|uniref:Uncharacterized protein (DUF2252 family) n=1 Tax=Murinocardiopsis flavida TaxID=645275 RepID=A0A2P8DNX4_9ACTN|nr:DUF2252 domain-containing protein [Murinocardiopsis flavida]PSK98901.1 uncharacterized protein (DUF2252 family) [Murinocardiopsis flavida]
MPRLQHAPSPGTDDRQEMIVRTLVDAFSELMEADPGAFRTKFRKMAADPFAFYRGGACVFYADVIGMDDPWADDRTSRVWIQGDLHAENFGTYMNAQGRLIFDVNDFDEAYLGHFTWDVQRFVASIALMAWSKALSDTEIDRLVRGYVGAYLDQVRWFAHNTGDEEYSLRLDSTDGAVHDVLQDARLNSRVALLDRITSIDGHERRFRDVGGVRRLAAAEYDTVCDALGAYLHSIPEDKRYNTIAYRVKDVVGNSGFGIGSAGLPAYSVLIEGFSEALDNDVILSLKQGNVAAPSRVVTDPRLVGYFRHHGHRTALSQRALQAHADPLLGHTEINGVGFVVSELSPYVSDLDWSELTEPEEILPVLDYLGRATAKAHCVSDSDSDQSLVPFQTESAILDVVAGREQEFTDWMADFAHRYAAQVRGDHALFVDAFRNDAIAGVRSTEKS